MSDWGDWLGRLWVVLEHSIPDMADEFEELIDGFILLVESHEAVRRSWGYDYSTDNDPEDEDTSEIEWLEKRARLYADANAKLNAVDEFLRGVGK